MTLVMQKYTLLTTEEKLALDHATFLKAVKLECIDRGIKPQITIEDAIRRTEYVGFQINPEHVSVFEVLRPGKYNDSKATGLCYLDRNLAEKALNGAVSCEEDGYGENKRTVINSGEFSIAERFISLNKMKNVQTKIEEFFQDDTEVDTVAEECRLDLQTLRQSEYDTRIRNRKKAEYLHLANQDETIARAFWAKTEGTEWPA